MFNKVYSLLKTVPLKLRLHIFYIYKFKKILNLYNPSKFSEFIQRRKLNQPLIFSELSDKFRVRDYVKHKVGSKHLIKLLGVYDNVNDIDYTVLPEKFVIKTNHGSGSKHIKIVKDKSKLSVSDIKFQFSRALDEDYIGVILGETQYNKIDRKIIIEDFIESNEDIIDYKFHMFNGEFVFLQVDLDRHTNHTRNIYDDKFKLTKIKLEYNLGRRDFKLPNELLLNKMKRIAEKLSSDFDYVRVDLYCESGNILFGELTFTPGSGFERFTPASFDYELGCYLT